MRRFVLIFLTLTLPSCSVVLASNQSGINVESIQTGWTRDQLLAVGATPASAQTLEQGKLVETFEIEKARGSVTRAFLHGLLDIGTAFLWELAATPLESALVEKKCYMVKVTFDDQERIEKLELQ